MTAPTLSQHERLHWLQACSVFLNRIGLPTTTADLSAADCFLPGLLVVKGTLQVDPAIAHPGDLLHEAGHLACLPQAIRAYASGDLASIETLSCQYLSAHPEAMGYPEDPFCRALLQCGDGEATAWQYAACLEIGMPEQYLFPKGSYGGESDVVLLGLKFRSQDGINGLQAAGWTKKSAAYPRPVPRYPELAFWLHPAQPVLGPVEDVAGGLSAAEWDATKLDVAPVY